MAQSSDICSICLQAKKLKDDISSLISCVHKFHRHCIKQWLRIAKHPTCPICRDSTSIEGISDTDYQPPNYKNSINNTNLRKSKRLKRLLKWKTKKYIYECSQCMECFNQKEALIEHEKMHNKQRPEPYNYKCGHCDYYDLFKDTFETHNIIEHNQSKPYQCKRCKKYFKRGDYLMEHIQSVHWKVRNYKCNACYAAFYTRKNLRIHSRIHLNKMPFKCSICDKGFAQKYNLVAHQVVHSSEKPFQCRLCHKRFRYKTSVCKHQKKFHQK
eukprot:294436_1